MTCVHVVPVSDPPTPTRADAGRRSSCAERRPAGRHRHHPPTVPAGHPVVLCGRCRDGLTLSASGRVLVDCPACHGGDPPPPEAVRYPPAA